MGSIFCILSILYIIDHFSFFLLFSYQNIIFSNICKSIADKWKEYLLDYEPKDLDFTQILSPVSLPPFSHAFAFLHWLR